MTSEDSIRTIKGIGEKTAVYYEKLGIRTVGDLLFYFPRSYETFDGPVTVREASKRDFASVRGVIMNVPNTRYVKKLQITETVIKDESGASLRLVWFNMPYLKNTLKPGSQYVFRGKIRGFGRGRQMDHPQIFRLADYEEKKRTLQPVYPLTAGLTGKALSAAVKAALSQGTEVPESLDPALLNDYQLMPLMDAVRIIHFPGFREDLIPA